MKAVAITAGLTKANMREQPWCYVHQVWCRLPEHGMDGVIVSDGYPRRPAHETIEGADVHRIRSVRCPPWLRNRPLQTVVRSQAPDVVLWNMGSTSLLHLATDGLDDVPIVGLFTSPMYSLSEVMRLGPRRVVSDLRQLYVHLLAAAVPRVIMSRALAKANFDALIVLTDKTKDDLVGLGAPSERIRVVPPGVNDDWLDASVDLDTVAALRQQAKLEDSGFLVLYLGDPSFLRGPDVLIRAVAVARTRNPDVRLVLLCRRRPNEHAADERRLRQLIHALGQDGATHLESGYLPRDMVRRWVAAADLVALPFLLVPSDAPISILEAVAAGKQVVATAVDGIPSLLPDGALQLVPPGNVEALAGAILEAAAGRGEHRSGQRVRWRRRWRDVAVDVAAVLKTVARNG